MAALLPQEDYKQVQRFSGAGDMGIDVAGFVDDKRLQGVWDNYQCKHYDHALKPSDVWAEFGKIIWYSFKGEYTAPRRYYFVAPGARHEAHPPVGKRHEAARRVDCQLGEEREELRSQARRKCRSTRRCVPM